MPVGRTDRRAFIAALGSAAAWPLAVRAQQSDQIRLVGMLSSIAEVSNIEARYAVFHQELQKLGWTDSRNIRFEYRWGGGDINKIRQQAEELIALAPDVILATGGPAMDQ